MRKIFLLQIILFYSIIYSQEPAFTRHTIGEFTGANDVSLIDINNDGYKDIIATGYQEGVCWWQNDGETNFTKHVISNSANDSFARTVRGQLSDGTILDFNNDDNPDLVSASMHSNKVTVWINDGSGTFTEVIIDNNSIGAHTVDVSDIDNDGDTDILIAAMGVSGTGTSSEFAIYYNNGDLNFEKRVLSSSSNMPTFIYACDLDNDDIKEILFVEYKTGKLGWYKLTDDTYEPTILQTYTGMHTTMAKDYDQDGDNDILAAAYTGCKFFLWQNDGNGIFTKLWEFTGYGGSWLDIADFNQDGYYDLVGAATNNRSYGDLYWFKNNGDDTFTSTMLSSNLAEAYCSYPADIDADGDIDIIVALSSGNKLEWWENTIITDIENDIETPVEFLLQQNYPNPFNPSTNISYHLNNDSYVSLEIFDMLGRKIAQLTNEKQIAGKHSYTWNASGFASGAYIYSITVNGENGNSYSAKKKMLLIK